jgi:hypothetical protein
MFVTSGPAKVHGIVAFIALAFAFYSVVIGVSVVGI